MKKEVNCNESISKKFPEILLGTAEDGIHYFDLTHYLKNRSDVTYNDYLSYLNDIDSLVQKLSKDFGIPQNHFFITNSLDGNMLIEKTFAILFLLYADDKFKEYMHERISKMMFMDFLKSINKEKKSIMVIECKIERN